MIEVAFYHLTARTVESALQTLLERTRARGWRAVVQAASEGRLKKIDEYLWSWRRDSFLAHGTSRDPDPASQPIYLTCDDTENPNSADIRFFMESAALAPVLESDAAPTTRASGSASRIGAQSAVRMPSAMSTMAAIAMSPAAGLFDEIRSALRYT